MRFKNRLGGGDNDAALELLSEAEKTARSLDNKSLLADVLNLIGLVFYDQELWVTTLETSLSYFEQALALKEAVDDQRGLAESLFNIGTAHQNKKGRTDEDLERAFECFQKAYRVAQEGGFRWEQAHAARHLGYIYGHQKGEPDLALAHHQEFLATNTELGFKPYLPPAHTRVGFTHLEMGNPDEAWEHFQTAQAMAAEIGYQAPLAEALFGLGFVLEKRGDASTALEHYERARAVARPINLIPVVRGASSRIAGLSAETDS
jgi:tetratricopeptide (TPR) repeat protein